MTKSEIMNCASILAAGIIAGGKNESCIGAEEAVGLMNQIADLIESEGKSEKKDALDKWIK